MSSNAIIPDFNLTAKLRAERRARLEQNLNASKDSPSQVDQAIAGLALTPGWGHLEDYIASQIDALQTMVQEAIGSGADFQEIGQRATLATLAGEELQSIIDFVRARAQSVKQS